MRISVYSQEENLKKWIRIWIFLALLIVQSVIIMRYSSQGATRSSEISRKVMSKLDWLPESIPREAEPAEPYKLTLHYIVRKLAHFYNFFVIGCALALLKAQLADCGYKDAAWVCYGLVLGIIDEVKQRFIPGRSGEFKDICIDFSGVLLGYIFVLLVLYVVLRRGASCGKK